MRFRFTLAELSGALADLGTLLPLTLALISVNGLNATSAFAGIGLLYLLNALVYRLPIPVQPLKSLAATAVALGLSGQVIRAGTWWMALIFLALALTNAIRLLERLFPKPVVRGIQLGLGLLLMQSAWGMITIPMAGWSDRFTAGGFTFAWAGLVIVGAGLVLVLLLWLRREWAALGVLVFGVGIALAHRGLPQTTLAVSAPSLNLSLPRPEDFWAALGLLVIPQLPLSLANSVFATSDAAARYFPSEASRATPRRLLATMGVGNLAVALLGGVPLCHGCGGLTAHFRLGAKTGGAPLMLAAIFLSIGLFGGMALPPLLSLIPLAALGVLLAYVGFQHTLLARDLRGYAEWLPALIVAVTALLTHSLAAGFALGAVAHFSIRGVTLLRDRRALKETGA